jgi:hypothetical protein
LNEEKTLQGSVEDSKSDRSVEAMKPSQKIKSENFFPFYSIDYFEIFQSDIHDVLIKMCNVVGLQMPVVVICHRRYIVALLFLLVFCTMFVNGCYQSYGDTYRMLHALVPTAFIVVIIGSVLNLFYSDYQKFAPSIQKKTVEFFEQHENNPKYREMLVKRADESELCLKMLLCCSFLCFHLPIVYSFALFAVTGEKFLFLNNYLPWTDPNETFGFILNLSLLTMLMPVACFGLLVLEIFFVFYGYQVVPLCDVLCSHLDEIGEGLLKLERVENSKVTTSLSQVVIEQLRQNKLKKLEAKLIEVIREHHEFDLFVKEIIFYTKLPCFFTITCNSLSIGLCIVFFFKISMALGIVGSKYP